MRFCPFCSAENVDELAVCQACGRRLPPLPPRRVRNAPPTGVTLPKRPASSSSPPPIPSARSKPPSAPPVPSAPTQPLPSFTPPPGLRDAPLPPPPVDRTAPPFGVADSRAQDNRELLNAISPGPAAERRDLQAEPRIIADRRGRNSSAPPPSVQPQFPRADSGFDNDTQISEDAPTTIEPHEPIVEPSPPPPTRTQWPEALVDRPFTPPKVLQVPEIPEPGLINAARYTYQFWVARWQRRGAIRQLGVEIKQDTEALDQVLGALGRAARGARVEGRVLSAENASITAAEERIAQLQRDTGEVEGRKAEENSKFVDVERERNEKLAEAERTVEEVQRELAHLEAQRRSLRDKRKELERRQRAYLKSAEDHDRQAGSAPMGDQRQELRRVAEGHRKEAAALEPERQDIDRRLGSVERPIGEATAKLDAGKAELDAAKRSLNDAREGHTHRLAELDAEQKRKAREVALAESEIQRRLVTLGTLVNLNRIEDPQFDELYQRIDRLRGAITARTTEIEKLTAEREAFDRGTLVRGVATIGGAFVLLIALVVILRAIL